MSNGTHYPTPSAPKGYGAMLPLNNGQVRAIPKEQIKS